MWSYCEWQVNACSTLGIRFVRWNTVRSGGPCVPLKAPETHTIRRIAGDGNCLFRSLSYVVTGSEDQHVAIRQRIVLHMFKISHLLLGIHVPNRYRSVEEYFRDTEMHHFLHGTFAEHCHTFLRPTRQTVVAVQPQFCRRVSDG